VDEDQSELLEKVAEAMTRGQGSFTQDELQAAFQKAWQDFVAGQAVVLLLEGKANLQWMEGELHYSQRPGSTPPGMP
jgi:hypothetical protein